MFGEDKRNLVIAIAAIFVILVGWQFLMPVLFPPDERPARVADAPSPDALPAERVTVEAVPGDGPEAPAQARQAGIDSPRVAIDSPRIQGSISRLGGRIDSVTLRGYHETADEESPEIVLLSPRDAARPYFADFGWASTGDDVALPRADTLWEADRAVVDAGRPVTLRWDNGAGLSFTRRIAIDDGFVFTVTQSVRNETAAPIDLVPFSRIARFSTSSESMLPFKPLFLFQDGALGVFGGDYHEADYEDMLDAYDALGRNPRALDEYRYQASGGWLGMTDKYWLVALIPDQETPFQGSFEYVPVDGGETDSFQAIYEAAPFTVNPGQTVALTSHLFAGAKEINLLDRYEETLGAERLDLAVDFGPTWFLSKPLFYVIDFFNRATGNFGVAILLLTICVRVLLFPLANKAYASMSRMRKLQPEMIRLRERFKDDKQRMNSELMKLYREQKANPVAGCLPLLAQIPVFFALYYMLFVTIEMRHAPFFGWIDDLSAPDPMTFITGFGLLEWPVPEFLLIGIWPLLFGATMWLQMKLNPQPMEPIQQKILMALPIVFLFLFARFPAGLVVYWTWNNVLSIGQQWLIMRRMGITRQSLAEDAEKIRKIKEAAEKGTLIKPSRSPRKERGRAGEAEDAPRRARKPAAHRKTAEPDGAARAPTRERKGPRRDAAASGGARREGSGANRKASARDEAADAPRGPAKRKAPVRRKPAPRKPTAAPRRRKPGTRRKATPPGAAQASLFERVKAGFGGSATPPETKPEAKEPPRKSRRQRKAERAAARAEGAGKSATAERDAPRDARNDDGEWTGQKPAGPRRTKTRTRARPR